MLISTDRTGFPLVVVEEAGVEIQLLPVTKWQFAQFMAEAKTELQEAYQEMLTLNPAAAHEHFSDREREQLFVSGILPEEALAFARWLGEGFDLPTLKEWRAVYAALRREPPPRHHQIQDFVDGVAEAILLRLSEQIHIRSMRDFSLMSGGLVEWSRSNQEIIGVGVPRPEFHPNLWDVLSNEIRPIRPTQRVRYFGFRLVRRGDWYLSDKDEARYIF